MTKMEILALLLSAVALSQLLRSRRRPSAGRPVFGPRDVWPDCGGQYPLGGVLPRRQPVRRHRMLLRSCVVRRRR
ncbi:hypothetical protein Aab01nite_21550 [Paractinoplanes abujensis]|uniref:Uncharacterized protein n=1 Tax=Paractinoplanes abujensis TaxID=882441 RepID=A0A7W7D0Z6_9ACTN|nr:hypothetical protein [Actinoplanes abujensis]MBB4696963.1 hypothetical protein [Actinoplanes abujensis]GID18565.1 hypothetical protein Aab01nite_21550 [Actinoplanes abujensis]